MICEEDLREKMEVLVKLLLLFSIMVLCLIDVLVKTFTIKLFTRNRSIQKGITTFRVIYFIQNMK